MNSTTIRTQAIICYYSLSGSYGTLARWLFYALIFITFTLYRFPVIVAGSFAAALITSFITLVHLAVLESAANKHGNLDLDVFGAKGMVETSLDCLVMAQIFYARQKLKLQIDWFHGIALSICLIILGWSGWWVERVDPYAFLASAASRNETFRVDGQYACLNVKQMLRLPGDLNTWSVYEAYYAVGTTKTLRIVSSFYLWISRITGPFVIVLWLTCVTTTDAFDKWLTSWLRVRYPIFERPLRNATALQRSCDCVMIFLFLRTILGLWWSEAIFLRSYFPVSEQPFYIGQWGPAAAAAIAIIYASVKWRFGKEEERKTGHMDEEAGGEYETVPLKNVPTSHSEAASEEYSRDCLHQAPDQAAGEDGGCVPLLQAPDQAARGIL